MRHFGRLVLESWNFSCHMRIRLTCNPRIVIGQENKSPCHQKKWGIAIIISPWYMIAFLYPKTIVLHYLFPDRNAEASRNRNFRCELLGLLGNVEKGLGFRNPNTLKTSLKNVSNCQFQMTTIVSQRVRRELHNTTLLEMLLEILVGVLVEKPLWGS